MLAASPVSGHVKSVYDEPSATDDGDAVTCVPPLVSLLVDTLQ